MIVLLIWLFVMEWEDVSRWPRLGFFELEIDEKCFKLGTGSPYALNSLVRSPGPVASLTGEANEFLISGLGVIYIEMNLLCETAVALGLVVTCTSLFNLVMFGIDAMSFYGITTDGSCDCSLVLNLGATLT